MSVVWTFDAPVLVPNGRTSRRGRDVRTIALGAAAHGAGRALLAVLASTYLLLAGFTCLHECAVLGLSTVHATAGPADHRSHGAASAPGGSPDGAQREAPGMPDSSSAVPAHTHPCGAPDVPRLAALVAVSPLPAVLPVDPASATVPPLLGPPRA